MVSQARLDANRRNAKKSTGPRSEEGKRRSSMNAVKHGITARFAVLPDEDPALFERRMYEWVNNFRPQSDEEQFFAIHAVTCSWQLERAQRAQSARLCFRAQTALDRKQHREAKEAMKLGLRLFRKPSRARTNRSQEQPEAQEHQVESGLCQPDAVDDADQAALLVLGLEQEAMLGAGGSWNAGMSSGRSSKRDWPGQSPNGSGLSAC